MFSRRKADPLLSIGRTDYKDTTVEQLRAEAKLLSSVGGFHRGQPYPSKEVEDRADALINRYCKENHVRLGRLRGCIHDELSMFIMFLNCPKPPWISPKQLEKIPKMSTDEALLDHIDWLVKVRFKDS